MNTLRFSLRWAVLMSCLTAVSMYGADDRRVLTLTGESTVTIPTTHAAITVSIEARESSPDAAQRVIGEKSGPLLEFLRREEVEKLRTTGLSLHPIIDHRPARGGGSDPSQNVIGYQASWSVSFRVPIDKAGRLVDDVVKQGANRVSQFQLVATDEAMTEASREAWQEAARKARVDADAVLSALGLSAQEIVRIQVNPGAQVYPMRARMEMMAAADVGRQPTAVEGGNIEVNGSVTLEIAY